jgi:thiamine-monophosphate kinase
MTIKHKLRELSELGEFKLIEHLTANFQLRNKSSVKGIGDDAAVIRYGKKMLVLTTDLLIEGIHFNLVYTPLKHLGYKSVVAGISDIYAMNARPEQITVSVAVSNKISVESLEEYYAGIKLACERYQVDLVGGDTSSSMTGMIVSVTVLGTVIPEKLVYRSGAALNDLICVSGNLGAAYAGLQVLERERRIFQSDQMIQPDLKGYGYVLERQLKPEARKDVIEMLEEAGILPTSMIDISDGLSSDLFHICKQSKVGCRIYMERIPIAEETAKTARELNIEPVICALNGGEDYELLFTVPLNKSEIIGSIPGISVIGHITGADWGKKMVMKDGSEIVLTAQGWNETDSKNQ